MTRFGQWEVSRYDVNVHSYAAAVAMRRTGAPDLLVQTSGGCPLF